MTATEQRELTQWVPNITYNGEDCIIIPIRQIINVDYTIDTFSQYEFPRAELVLTVRSR